MATLSLRDHFAYLPPPAESLAILLGITDTLVFGLAGLTDPPAFLAGYGLKSSSTLKAPTSDQPTATESALTRALASRNLQNGILVLTFGLYTRDRRSLGLAVGLGAIASLADAMIVNANGIKDLMGAHVVGLVGRVMLGTGLLYWGRGDKLW